MEGIGGISYLSPFLSHPSISPVQTRVELERQEKDVNYNESCCYEDLELERQENIQKGEWGNWGQVVED